MRITSAYLGLILIFFSCKDYNSLLNPAQVSYSNVITEERIQAKNPKTLIKDQKLYDDIVSLAQFFENCNFMNYLNGMNPIDQTLKILKSMMNPDKEEDDEDENIRILVYSQKKLTRRYTRKELLSYRYIIKDMRRQWNRDNEIEVKEVGVRNGNDSIYYGESLWIRNSIDISDSPRTLEEAQDRLKSVLYLFDHPQCLQSNDPYTKLNRFKNDVFSLDVADMSLQTIMQVVRDLLEGADQISLEKLYSSIQETYEVVFSFFKTKIPYLKDGIDIDLSVFREPYQKVINILSALETVDLSKKEETEALLEQVNAFYEEYPRYHILKKIIAQIDERAKQVEDQIDKLLEPSKKKKKKRKKNREPQKDETNIEVES